MQELSRPSRACPAKIVAIKRRVPETLSDEVLAKMGAVKAILPNKPCKFRETGTPEGSGEHYL